MVEDNKIVIIISVTETAVHLLPMPFYHVILAMMILACVQFAKTVAEFGYKS